MIHLTIHQLSSFIDRELPESSTELVRRHLESCEECRLRFTAFQEQEAVLDRLLVHEPGAAFLLKLPDDVLGAEAKRREERARSDRRAGDRRVTERRVTERRMEERRVTDRRAGAPERRAAGDRRGAQRAGGEKEPAHDAAVVHPRPIVSWKPVATEDLIASGERPREESAAPIQPQTVPAEDQAPPEVTMRAVLTPRAVLPPRAAPAPRPSPRPIARRSQPAVPWFAAIILCVMVGAIAYLIPRPASLSRPSSRAAPEEPSRPPRAVPGPAISARNGPPERVAHGTRVSPPAASEPQPPVEAGAEPTPAVATNEPEPPAGSEIAPNIAVEPAPEPARPAPLAPAPATSASPAPDREVVPVRRFITTTEASPPRPPAAAAPPAPRAPQPAPKPDVFASAPETARPLVAAARSASRAAALDSSAVNLDAAAEAWDRAIPALDGALKTAARRNLAEARYRAWVAAPDPYRVANATAALRAYLVFAPSGRDRDAAKTWLSRVAGGL